MNQESEMLEFCSVMDGRCKWLGKASPITVYWEKYQFIIHEGVEDEYAVSYGKEC